MRERYVILGLARARADWFSRVGRWSTSASIPAEFVRCISVAELRARLQSGRSFSAALLDGSSPGVDRDLLAALRAAATPALVIDDADGRPWTDLGAATVLRPELTREDLLEALATHAAMVTQARLDDVTIDRHPVDTRRGQVIAVTGPGGTGASTVAIALAQGLAAAGRGQVLLADCNRVAEQAMLHDSRVVVPGIQELVEAHRAATPAARDVREQTFDVVERGYRLLLGLRRPSHWVTIRPQAFDAMLDGLERAFDVVVADIEGELEGEAETGSVDVEDRHVMARATASRASAVVVVGMPGMKGLHALVRSMLDLLSFGVPGRRIVPVINQAPRSPRDRAELTTSLASLARASLGASGAALPSPVFLPRRKVDTALLDGVPIPSPLPKLLVGAVAHVLDDTGIRQPDESQSSAAPARVAPGSLGLFTSSSQEPPRP